MYSKVVDAIDFIKQFEPLKAPTDIVKNWLDDHPTAFKVALIANHLFRAVMMAGFMLALPYSPLVNGLICAVGTLFYRLTIQGNCPYLIDVTALFGATSLLLAKSALPSIIEGVAFSTFKASGQTLASLLPLAGYAIYVFITSEKKCKCCT